LLLLLVWEVLQIFQPDVVDVVVVLNLVKKSAALSLAVKNDAAQNLAAKVNADVG